MLEPLELADAPKSYYGTSNASPFCAWAKEPSYISCRNEELERRRLIKKQYKFVTEFIEEAAKLLFQRYYEQTVAIVYDLRSLRKTCHNCQIMLEGEGRDIFIEYANIRPLLPFANRRRRESLPLFDPIWLRDVRHHINELSYQVVRGCFTPLPGEKRLAFYILMPSADEFEISIGCDFLVNGVETIRIRNTSRPDFRKDSLIFPDIFAESVFPGRQLESLDESLCVLLGRDLSCGSFVRLKERLQCHFLTKHRMDAFSRMLETW